MSFARGFIKGFIGQSLDKKAAADAALADLNARVAENYLTNIQPNFIKNENKIEKRFNLIQKKYDRPTALYALSNKLTDTDYGFRQIMDLDDSDATKLQNYTKTIDFGNLVAARKSLAGTSDNTRGIFAGGYISPATTNVMNFVTIATTGDAADFGDLSTARRDLAGFSDSHGGLS